MTPDSNRNFDGLDRAICVRMKSTLTKRGCHFKTPGYRVRVKAIENDRDRCGSRRNVWGGGGDNQDKIVKNGVLEDNRPKSAENS